MFSHSKFRTAGQTLVTCKDSLKIFSLISFFDHICSYKVTHSTTAGILIKKCVLTGVEEM